MKPNWRRRAAQQAERDRRALERLCWHESAHATINHAYGVRSHGHGPQKDAASFGYERRDGITRPSASPDALRVTAAFERRTDGCFV
jgi:hypothetical protein